MHKRNPKSYALTRRQNGLILWERWVLATAVAELVGLNMAVVINASISMFGNLNMYAILLLVGILEGAVLGFAQWLVLRRYIHNATRWILATTIGALLAWLIGLLVSIIMAFASVLNGGRTATLLLGVVLLGTGVGTVLGFAQWLVLKPYVRVYLRSSAWWVFPNALAWSQGLLVAFLGAGIEKSHEFSIQTALIGTATGATMGVMVGGITGIALVWLLKPRLKQH